MEDDSNEARKKAKNDCYELISIIYIELKMLIKLAQSVIFSFGGMLNVSLEIPVGLSFLFRSKVLFESSSVFAIKLLSKKPRVSCSLFAAFWFTF